MGDTKKKIKNKIQQTSQESMERLKKKTVETTKETFTVLGQDVLKQLFDIDPKKNAQPKEGTYTPLGEDIRNKMGENFSQQEAPELERIRQEIAGHNPEDAVKQQLKKTQLEHVRKEEKEAREYMRRKEEERLKEEQEEMERRRAEEQQKQQDSAHVDEPQGKQARGSLFAKKKKPKQTIENKPAQGKQ